MPWALIVPQVTPLHPEPVTLHNTTVLDVPVTVAVKETCPPSFTCVDVGDTAIVTAAPMPTVAVPDWVGAATEVALTVTAAGLGGVAGAVYKPVDVMVPQAAPAHPAPETLQVTAVFVAPLTAALNCTCPPAVTWAGLGDTVTEMVPED